VSCGVGALVIGGAVALYWLYYDRTTFEPFGRVTGPFGTDPGRGYTNWAWFGVKDPKDFSSYKISEFGDVPLDFPYVSGGLVALVIDTIARSSKPGVYYNAGYKGMAGAAGIAAWGLVPIPSYWSELAVGASDSGKIDGVLVVAASRTANDILATRFVNIGASDAVAMDGNNSAMFGTGTSIIIPNPRTKDWKFREELQKYGFFCH
jgi:hypothetical protein